MDATPSIPLHRFQAELNWSRTNGQPVEGDVVSCMVDGQEVYNLRAQPRGTRPVVGVSFFAPSPDLSAAAHSYLGHEALGCSATAPHTALPSGLRLVSDGPLQLPLQEAERTVICGEHWTLYSAEDMGAAQFEQAYSQLAATCVPCHMPGQAEPLNDSWEVDNLDMDGLPGDKHTRACTMALDDLANCHSGPNVRLFAKLFALHLKATDMDFQLVLEFGAIANMAATALEAWTVRDPFLLTDACMARDLLAQALECTVSAPTYTPHWVHPFQLLSGQYSEELYDKAVQVCARGFMEDETLRALVRESAMSLFQQLDASGDSVKLRSASFQHHGITFHVECGANPGVASCLHGSHGSGTSDI